MHFQRGRKPQNCPFLLGLRYSTGGGPSHGDRQHAQKFGKDRACGSGDYAHGQADSQTDTQRDRHTDLLITIRRHRCCYISYSNTPYKALQSRTQVLTNIRCGHTLSPRHFHKQLTKIVKSVKIAKKSYPLYHLHQC